MHVKAERTEKMKKLASFVSALALTTAFSATCVAMQFQQPVFIGSFSGIAGGPRTADRWYISKEVSVKKDSLVMGKGKTALFFKYKDTPSKYDNSKYRSITSIVSGNGNVFPVDNEYGYISTNHCVYQINGENGVVAYVDIMYSGAIDPPSMCIRGLWKEGKAVTYVKDVYHLANGISEPGFDFKHKEMKVKGDTICVPYSLKSGEFGKKLIRNGELRFKWDDKAFWFGIEDVVY